MVEDHRRKATRKRGVKGITCLETEGETYEEAVGSYVPYRKLIESFPRFISKQAFSFPVSPPLSLHRPLLTSLSQPQNPTHIADVGVVAFDHQTEEKKRIRSAERSFSLPKRWPFHPSDETCSAKIKRAFCFLKRVAWPRLCHQTGNFCSEMYVTVRHHSHAPPPPGPSLFQI